MKNKNSALVAPAAEVTVAVQVETVTEIATGIDTEAEVETLEEEETETVVEMIVGHPGATMTGEDLRAITGEYSTLWTM